MAARDAAKHNTAGFDEQTVFFTVVGLAFAAGAVLLVLTVGSSPSAATEHILRAEGVAWPLGGRVVYGTIRVAARDLDTDNRPLNRPLFDVDVGDARPVPGVDLSDPFRRWRGQTATERSFATWEDLPPSLTQNRPRPKAPRGLLVRALAVAPGQTVTRLGPTVFIGAAQDAQQHVLSRLRRVRSVATLLAIVAAVCISLGVVVWGWSVL